MNILNEFDQLKKYPLDKNTIAICNDVTYPLPTRFELERTFKHVELFPEGNSIYELTKKSKLHFDYSALSILLFCSNGDLQIAPILMDYFVAWSQEKGFDQVYGFYINRDIVSKGLPSREELIKLARNKLDINPDKNPSLKFNVNILNPKLQKAKDFMFVSSLLPDDGTQKILWEHHLTWVAQFFMTLPRAEKDKTQAELIDLGYVGLYEYVGSKTEK